MFHSYKRMMRLLGICLFGTVSLIGSSACRSTHVDTVPKNLLPKGSVFNVGADYIPAPAIKDWTLEETTIREFASISFDVDGDPEVVAHWSRDPYLVVKVTIAGISDAANDGWFNQLNWDVSRQDEVWIRFPYTRALCSLVNGASFISPLQQEDAQSCVSRISVLFPNPELAPENVQEVFVKGIRVPRPELPPAKPKQKRVLG